MKKTFTLLIASLFAIMLITQPVKVVGQTTVTQTGFSGTSGTSLNNDNKITFTSYQGGGTSAPQMTGSNSDIIRLYQKTGGGLGGYIVIGVAENYVITSISITPNATTKAGYMLTNTNPGSTTPNANSFVETNHSCSSGTPYSVSNISSRYVVFGNFGDSNSNSTRRLDIKTISVTYTPTHTLTYSAQDGGSITSVKFGNTTIASNTKVGQGLVLDIVAAASDGYNFDGWTATGTNYSFEDDGSTTTTFTMGSTDCEIIANFVSAGPTQLSTPTNFSGTPGNNQISFTWDAVANASSYTISYTPADDTEHTETGISGTSKTITGLTNDIVHTCKIKAVTTDPNYSDSEYSSTISVTPTGATYYTVTPTSPLTGGTVTALPTSATEGTTITLTATPADGYKFNNNVENWSITPTTTITPVASTNTATFSMPGTNVTAVAATFTPYTVTLQAGTGCTIGSTSSSTASWDVTQNSGNLPTATSPCDEKWVFEGWSTTNQTTQTETKPTLVSTAYVPTSDNITLYAVYKKTEEGPDPVAFSSGSTGNYAIVSEVISEKYYALPTSPTVSSGKIAGGEITVSTKGGVNYIETSNASGYTWIIANATYGYTISDGSKYVYHKNGGASSTDLDYGTGTDYTWNFVKDGSTNYYKITARNGSTVSTRGMLFSGTNLGGYALSNWGNSGYYKTMILPIVDGTKIYYISTPDCREQVETPVITLAGDSYNSDQTTEITCGEEGVTIYYTTDGTDPTNSSTEYTGAITIDRSMKIKAFAIKNDATMSDSKIASATYVLPPVYANIAAFKAAYTATSNVVVKITGPLTTVYHNGKNLYVQDATSSMLIYDSDGDIVTRTYENGQTISNIYGHYELYNSLIEFVPDRDLPTPGSGSPVEPTNIESLTDYATYDAKLVRLSNMTFTANASFTTGNAYNANMEDEDENQVQVRSRFKTLNGSISKDDVANVVGFVGINNTTIQLYPRDNDDIQYILETDEISSAKTIDFAAILKSGEIIEIENGGVLTVRGKFTNDGDIMVDNGGQLNCPNSVEATIYKNISTAWNPSSGIGWYTISTPTGSTGFGDVANLKPMDGDNRLYDIYRYKESTMTWENSIQAEFDDDDFEEGRGYLYRKGNTTAISFTGMINANESYEQSLSVTGETAIAGFALLGNPYSHNINLKHVTVNAGNNLDACYILSGEGAWGASIGNTADIAPCTGFLVQATKECTATIHKSQVRNSKANNDYIKFIVANNQYEDVTFALFDEGHGLNKINHRNSNIQQIYIPKDGENFAVATMADNTQSFNLNFKAMTMGQYKLSFKAKGEFNYLHVIDRMTGEDIDMLLEGEYSFIGSPQDNEARFIVRLGYLPNYDNNGADIFAYQNGSDVIVSGEGELQIFDVMGRMVSTQNVNGTETISVNAQGVYILRLVGTEIKTQKIVVR